MEAFTNTDTDPIADGIKLNFLSLTLDVFYDLGPPYLSSCLLILPPNTASIPVHSVVLDHLPQNYLQHLINAVYLRFTESEYQAIMPDNLHNTQDSTPSPF